MDLSMKGATAPVDYTNATGSTKTENVDTKKMQPQGVPVKLTETPAAKLKEPLTSASSTVAETKETAEQRVPDGADIAKEIAEANRKLMFSDRSFQYKVEDVTQRVVITVIDNETKEVSKEIPPEKQIVALRKMWELAGLIVDKKI